MGRRIRAQRLGRGSNTYKAPIRKRKVVTKYVAPTKTPLAGRVKEIKHVTGRSSPVAVIQLENGDRMCLPAAEGVCVGEQVAAGEESPIREGNILPVGQIPEGTYVYNLEARPGDGGKFARASGTYCLVVSHGEGETTVQLPSGSVKKLSSQCRATIGVVAGGGRTEKPWVKAGTKFHHLRARATPYPKVRGVAMNAVDHPHGGGYHHHPGKPTCVSRSTPPGRKVGMIAPKRTGKKK